MPAVFGDSYGMTEIEHRSAVYKANALSAVLLPWSCPQGSPLVSRCSGDDLKLRPGADRTLARCFLRHGPSPSHQSYSFLGYSHFSQASGALIQGELVHAPAGSRLKLLFHPHLAE